MGTGTYGQSNPTVITCGFKPKIVLFFCDTTLFETDKIWSNYLSKNGGAYKSGLNLALESNNLVVKSIANIITQISRLCFNIKDGGSTYNLAVFEHRQSGYVAPHNATISFMPSETGVSFYTDDYAVTSSQTSASPLDLRYPDFQFNTQGITYHYVVID